MIIYRLENLKKIGPYRCDTLLAEEAETKGIKCGNLMDEYHPDPYDDTP